MRRGGHVLGLCGGYQMLGRAIADPEGIEGPPAVQGLGLLDIDTVLTGDKRLAAAASRAPTMAHRSAATKCISADDGPIARGPLLASPMAGPDGAVSADGRVSGTYVHGLFADDRAARRTGSRASAAGADVCLRR